MDSTAFVVVLMLHSSQSSQSFARPFNKFIKYLAKVRESLTTDEKLWGQFMQPAHLNERAISLAMFCDPLQSMTLAMLFKQFKVFKKLSGDFSEWQQGSLDESEPV